MRVLRAWRVGLGAGVLLAAGWALAQEPPAPATDPLAAPVADPSADYPICTRTPTEADLEGAKGAHKAAIQFYERADYDRAIRYWKDAYEFDCTAHGVLINIASAYERKGDRASAIEALDAYLTRAPDAPDAVTIQERVQNLKAAVKAEQDKARQPPPPASTPAPPPPPPPPPLPPERPYGYAPLVVAGAGGVALVIGAILTPIGLSRIADAERDCPSRVGCAPAIADLGNSGRSQAAAGGVVMGLGALALGGGLAWHFALNKPVVPAQPAASPRGATPPAGPAPGVTPAPATTPGATPPAGGAPSAAPPGPGAAPPVAPAPPAGGASITVAPAVGAGFGGLSISGRF